MWTFAQVKAADAVLNLPDPGDAAAALNAQTSTVECDVKTSEARSVILPTGEYGALVLLSEQRDFATVPRALVVAAITAIVTFNSDRVVQAGDAVAWAGVETILAAFVQAGVLSADSEAAILAMRHRAVPAWMPPLDAGTIQTARAQP